MHDLTFEQLCILWLASSKHLSWKAFENLIRFHGSAAEVYQHFNASCSEQIGDKACRELLTLQKRGIEKLPAALDPFGCSLIFPLDDTYPSLLKQIHDPPHLLYVLGCGAADEKSVAIVGSRRDTRYGRSQAFSIARDLASAGVTVISGLARGIDTAVHEGALAGGGRTVAVLGCGIDRIYPEENKPLATKIIENGGAVISEFPLGSEPLAHHFPIRNRIISGMSAAVLLIEGGEKSGTMITANYAAEQGRQVFALPGNVDSPGSAAPLKLLRDGARICTCAEDILSDMQWQIQNHPAPSLLPPEEMFSSLPPRQRHIALLLWNEELQFDEIVAQSGISADELTSELTLMELDGIVEPRAGHAYAVNHEYKQ